MASALNVEIDHHRLRVCFYLSLRCRTHGEFRGPLAEPPSTSRYPCPECPAPCAFTLLGDSGTHRPLPFWDVLNYDCRRAQDLWRGPR